MGVLGNTNHHDSGPVEVLYPPPRPHQPRPEDTAELPRAERITRRVVRGGSAVEVVAGAVALTTAIVGIAGVASLTMAGVATIAIGLALLAQGGSIASRWPDLKRHFDGDVFDRTDIAGGIGTEVFGGVAGIVLGIVALAGVYPLVLLPAAAIVYGFALLLGGAAQPELAEIEVVPDGTRRRRRTTREAVEASGGVMVMVGLASGVLGLLSLLGVGPILTLTLVAMLCVGAAVLIAGGTLISRFARDRG